MQRRWLALPPKPQVTVLQSRPLDGAPGKEGTMILVEYAPGAVDPVHRHNASDVPV
jgi:quercetin dioxygenase-like cupin family protein